MYEKESKVFVLASVKKYDVFLLLISSACWHNCYFNFSFHIIFRKYYWKLVKVIVKEYSKILIFEFLLNTDFYVILLLGKIDWNFPKWTFFFLHILLSPLENEKESHKLFNKVYLTLRLYVIITGKPSSSFWWSGSFEAIYRACNRPPTVTECTLEPIIVLFQIWRVRCCAPSWWLLID